MDRENKELDGTLCAQLHEPLSCWSESVIVSGRWDFELWQGAGPHAYLSTHAASRVRWVVEYNSADRILMAPGQLSQREGQWVT